MCLNKCFRVKKKFFKQFEGKLILHLVTKIRSKMLILLFINENAYILFYKVRKIKMMYIRKQMHIAIFLKKLQRKLSPGLLLKIPNVIILQKEFFIFNII